MATTVTDAMDDAPPGATAVSEKVYDTAGRRTPARMDSMVPTALDASSSARVVSTAGDVTLRLHSSDPCADSRGHTTDALSTTRDAADTVATASFGSLIRTKGDSDTGVNTLTRTVSTSLRK
jgi:hypothetical protein